MSNLDIAPAEQECFATAAGQPVQRLLPAREVPLGGVRAMTVSRTLPSRELPLVGAWCFFDQMGPERVDMRLLPHPHIGLQTVTWPLAGQVRHRDSLGSDVVINPSELNIMTSGAGIAHSEFSLPETAPGTGSVEHSPLLHALQLWVALPADVAAGPASFEQHRNLPQYGGTGVQATVFIGSIGGAHSPALVHTPLLGADLDLAIGANTAIPLRPDFEHAILVIEGSANIAGVDVAPGPLLYLGTGRDQLRLASATGARLVLLGGEPFPDELVMWWNFVGRSHDEIVQARTDWENHTDRFGVVPGHGADRIPAPPMPPMRLTPRRRAI